MMVLCACMLKSIQDRYGNVKQESLYVLATILDPRFKLKGFMSASSTAHARMLLITECEIYLKKCQSDSDQPQPKRSRRDSSEKSSSALWNLFDELIADSGNCKMMEVYTSTCKLDKAKWLSSIANILKNECA